MGFRAGMRAEKTSAGERIPSHPPESGPVASSVFGELPFLPRDRAVKEAKARLRRDVAGAF